MSELTTFLYTWVPVFVILSISIIGLLKFAGIRSHYMINEMRNEKKIIKEKDTFGGAIKDMIDSAPNNLKQIESEIATIQAQAIKQNLTPEQIKALTQRLESERDMLKLASKYGHLLKPLGGTIGKLLEKTVGNIGGI